MANEKLTRGWVSLRVSVRYEDYQRVKACAEGTGLSVAAIIRRAALGSVKRWEQDAAPSPQPTAPGRVYAAGDRVWAKHKNLDTDEMMTSLGTVVGQEGAIVSLTLDHALGDVRRYRAAFLWPAD